MQEFALKMLQECGSWVSRNGAVQMFFCFPGTKQKHICFLKNLESERFLLGSVSGAYYFQRHVS